MSLINDALRRARQAQQEAPPPVTPNHFRPVEPKNPAARHGVGLLVPVSLGLVALLALLLLWELSRREPNVAARVLPSDTTPSLSKVQSLPAPSVSEANSNSSSIRANTPAASATVVRPDLSTSTNATLKSASLEVADTNHTASADPSITPSALKLQGIVFNPRKPSALINGRVMFVGDRIRDLRIAAIHPDAVVLTSPGRTNVLSLEP